MLEMADIFSQYGTEYIDKYGEKMLPGHKRVIRDIINCRTSALGGQVFECPDGHTKEYSYHSCMNRHCPKCQNNQADKWLQKRQEKLLATPYFFLTFPLPAELRQLAKSNQKTIYDILLKTAAQAMQKLALDPKFVGGQIGLMGVLHTWRRDLAYHLHAHFLAPAGGLSRNRSKPCPPQACWLPARNDFFLPAKALSVIFRAKFRDALKQTDLFDKAPPVVWKKDWVVHCKEAGNGENVLKYFAPYVYRVAISNRKLVKLENGNVTFRFKDSKTKQWKMMTLPVFRFMHRFLQHILPKGFKKVRYYGFLSSNNKLMLNLLKYRLGTPQSKTDEVGDEPEKDSSGIHHPTEKHICPVCGKPMVLVAVISRFGRDPPLHRVAA
jgi:hypothetical protein